MQGFFDCILNHAQEHDIPDEKLEYVQGLFDDLTDEFGRSMSPAAARAQAEKRVMDILKKEVKERKRRVLLQADAIARIDADTDLYRQARGSEDRADAVLALIERDEFATYSSLRGRADAIRGQAHARMTKVLSTFRRDVLGRVRDPATLDQMVREVFGTDTGNIAAKDMAAAWGDTADMLRQWFNTAGGAIPKRKDWGLPQHHDSLKVSNASFDEWRDFILPKLDTGRMLDDVTGEPIPPQRIEPALRDAWEKIRTDGMAAIKPSGVSAGKSLARRHADHRFLVFNSADDWLDYHNKFGSGTPFDVMLGHLDRMSRDIATLEIFGPNPNATMTWLGQTLDREAGFIDGRAGNKMAGDKARRATKAMRDMFSLFNGSANAPIDGRFARGFAGLRNVLTAAKLGSATLTAVTDFNFTRIASKMVGLKTTPVMGKYLALMTPGNMADRELAVRLGLIADNWSQLAAAQQRYVGEVTGPEIAQRLSNFVLDVSLLSPHTQAGRWAFGMEFSGLLADMQGKAWSDLPDPLKNTMVRYGINSGDWASIRNTPLYEHGGAKFLRPEDIYADAVDPISAELRRKTAFKVLEMITGETEYAIPTASLRGRAAFVGDTKPGTFQGELLRSTMMYKNFAVTLFLKQSQRMKNLPAGSSAGVYAADFAISMTLMGAMAIQLKEISKGRDPRPMAGEHGTAFWGAAFLQGGGLGIFGDFLFSDVNRFGGGLAETLAGPVVQFANDVRRLTVGNVLQLPGDKPTNAGRELVNFLRSNTPGGSIWYARLGVERLLLDQLQLLLDRKAQSAFRRRTQNQYRNYGNDYFWGPGELAPDRAPDLLNMAGE